MQLYCLYFFVDDNVKKKEIMTSNTFTRRRVLVQQKKKKENIYSYTLLGLFLFSITNLLFLQPKMIGYNRNMDILVLWTPVIIGVLILSIRCKKLLNSLLSSNEYIIPKLTKVFSYLFLAGVISYITLGQIANITWNVLSRFIANNNPKEIFICEVKEINKDIGIRAHADQVIFLFQDRNENIETSVGTLNKYESNNPEKYNIVVECQRGVNCFIVLNWKIVEKNRENQSSN